MAEFYLDHNVARETAVRIQSTGHGARTVQDLGLPGAEDYAHLLIADQNGWIFVTHDRSDFMLLHGAWRAWTRAWGVVRAHAGILVIPQSPRWRPIEAAAALTAFPQADLPLENELYSWQADSGWVRKA